jgi:hypothetical protein
MRKFGGWWLFFVGLFNFAILLGLVLDHVNRKMLPQRPAGEWVLFEAAILGGSIIPAALVLWRDALKDTEYDEDSDYGGAELWPFLFALAFLIIGAELFLWPLIAQQFLN